MSKQQKIKDLGKVGLAALAAVLWGLGGTAQANHPNQDIEGVSGTVVEGKVTFDLTAKVGYLSTGDGNSIYFWGLANTGATGSGKVQYPGPTLIVNQGDVVAITLNNTLPVATSLVFPGHTVTTSGGSPGALTAEAAALTGTVTYTFKASQPGTYLYNSGTSADLQVEMGLVGAIIVRPAGFDPLTATGRTAYGTPDTAYNHEYLFLLTDMDERVHTTVEQQVRDGLTPSVDTTDHFPVYWFINGRTGPDTLLGAGADAPWLASQPYNCMPLMNPGQKLLMRVIGAGRDPHPYHHHGNHAQMIAKNGRLLWSGVGVPSADLASFHYTIPSFPGTTIDSIFTWTGHNVGWDIYGHKRDVDNAPVGWRFGPEDVDIDGDRVYDAADGDVDNNPMGWSIGPGPEDIDYNGDLTLNGEDPVPGEWGPDHLKPLPTALPLDQDLTFGQMYGGSPYLGAAGPLPPGEGGFNPNNGYMFMWHSHNEKEIVNNDIFPGGMLTLLLIEAP